MGRTALAALALAVLCAGCATPGTRLDAVFQPPAIVIGPAPQETPTEAKAAPLFSTAPGGDARLQQVDLAAFIAKDEKDIDQAMLTFRRSCASQGSGCMADRNAVQDRLIAASNTICKSYKSGLKQAHASTNLAFGGASTLLGGLGAMATATNAARYLAGAAGITSGVRAETNQNIYAMLAIEVITKAMDKTRMDRLREIDESQKKGIANYSLERAIADAMNYHEGCSLLAGLQEAAVAVSQSESVGLKALHRTMDDLGQTVQLPIGRKAYVLDGKDAVFLVAACTDRKAQYDSFVKNHGISVTAKEYKAANDYWTGVFNAAAYCKDFDTPHGSPAAVDKQWTQLVTGFPALTDDEERQRVIRQVAAQQASAKATLAALDAAYERSIAQLRTARARYADAERAVAAVKMARAKLATRSPAPGETDAARLAEYRAAVRELALHAERALDQVKFAEALAPAADLAMGVQTAVGTARLLDEKSEAAASSQAAAQLITALNNASW